MIVDAKYTYVASVLRRRKRTPESLNFTASVPVEVVELGDAEAPVALRTTDRRTKGTVEVRFHDGLFYRSLDAGRDGPEDVENLVAASLFSGSTTWGEIRGKAEDYDDVAATYSDDRDEVVAAVHDSARRVILVDGRPWTVVPEPYLKVDMDRQVPLIETVLDGDMPSNSLSCFRIDQESLVANAKPEFGPNGGKPSGNEVLLTDCYRLRAYERFVAFGAKRLVGDMASRLADAETDFFEAYRSLREESKSLDLALGQDQPFDMEPVVKAAHRAVSACVSAAHQWDWHGEWADEMDVRSMAEVDLDAIASMAP